MTKIVLVEVLPYRGPDTQCNNRRAASRFTVLLLLASLLRPSDASFPAPPVARPDYAHHQDFHTDKPRSVSVTNSGKKPRIVMTSIPWRGHVNPLKVLGQELVERGFDVSLALMEDCHPWVRSDSGVKFVPLKSRSSPSNLQRSPEETSKGTAGVDSLMATLGRYQKLMSDDLYQYVSSHPPDLMIIDRFTFAGFETADALNISFIINNPQLLLDYDNPPIYIPTPLQHHTTSFDVSSSTELHEEPDFSNNFLSDIFTLFRLGNFMAPKNQATHNETKETTYNSPYLDPFSFSLGGRCRNMFLRLQYKLDMFGAFAQLEFPKWVAQEERRVDSAQRESEEGEEEVAVMNDYDLRGILDNHVVLTNTILGFEYTRPMHSRFVMVGPMLPSPSNKPLAIRDNLKDWLDASIRLKSDVILIYFNESDDLTQKQAKALVNGLGLLDDEKKDKKKSRVLVVLPDDPLNIFDFNILPKGLNHVTDLPHSEILGILQHPAVKVYISHCGLTGVQEALYFSTPVLCIPFFSDQWEVSQRVTHSGAGLTLNRENMDREKIEWAVNQLIHNNSFTNATKRISEILWTSRGSSHAAEIVRVCHETCQNRSQIALATGDTKSHKFCAHLLTHDFELPWWQNYLLDVCSVCGIILGTLAIIVKILWTGCCSIWRAVKTEYDKV